jgi:hypothetical protein
MMEGMATREIREGPPVALLALALARLREVDPDHPGWIERYHRQGLTHILVGGGEASS